MIEQVTIMAFMKIAGCFFVETRHAVSLQKKCIVRFGLSLMYLCDCPYLTAPNRICKLSGHGTVPFQNSLRACHCEPFVQNKRRSNLNLCFTPAVIYMEKFRLLRSLCSLAMTRGSVDSNKRPVIKIMPFNLCGIRNEFLA